MRHCFSVEVFRNLIAANDNRPGYRATARANTRKFWHDLLSE